jgi:hypothetical protein|mmetsp:Transcript_85559/g.142476  ORF Transcript_85559/g.142476 Transcript_85559/m.142476 type:complete len:89 (+) Transcript_85559:236-502(+)
MHMQMKNPQVIQYCSTSSHGRCTGIHNPTIAYPFIALATDPVEFDRGEERGSKLLKNNPGTICIHQEGMKAIALLYECVANQGVPVLN